MLVVLKPWHKLEKLRRHEQTWREAFKHMLSVNPENQCIVSNIEYHYECKEAAERDKNMEDGYEGERRGEERRRRRRQERVQKKE